MTQSTHIKAVQFLAKAGCSHGKYLDLCQSRKSTAGTNDVNDRSAPIKCPGRNPTSKIPVLGSCRCTWMESSLN